MEDDCPDWFDTLNQKRRDVDDPDHLSPENRRDIDSEVFKHCTMMRASNEASINGMVVSIGCGDLGSTLIQEIEKLDKKIVTVGIDSKITVGSSFADYFLQLGGEPRLWDTDRLIGMLKGLLPKKSTDVTPLPKSAGFRPLQLAPMLIGEYHGFDAKTIFEEAEKLGYQVLPDTATAIWAMDKTAFWRDYHNRPSFAPYILPQIDFAIPPRAVDELHDDTEAFASKRLVEETKLAIAKADIKYPGLIKPAISEFGYGQARVDKEENIFRALRVAAEQCNKYKVSPGYRMVVQPFAERKTIARLAGRRPIELLQMVVQHLNRQEELETTCLSPIWFVNHQVRPFPGSNIPAGPQVFDFAIQAPVTELPEEFLSKEEYAEICQKSIELIKSMTSAPGLYGLEIFIMADGSFKFNRLSVRTQDTMLATLATQQVSAFSLLARLISNDRIDKDELAQTYSGGVKTIVWEGEEAGKVIAVTGVDKVKRDVPYVMDIRIHEEKFAEDVRPLRRYGLIYIRAPLNTSIDEIKAAMEQARTGIKIFPETGRKQ